MVKGLLYQHTAKVVWIKFGSRGGADCACNTCPMGYVSMRKFSCDPTFALSGLKGWTYKDPNKNDNATSIFCFLGSWSFNTGITGTSKIIQSIMKFEIEFPQRNGITAMQCPGFPGIQALSIGWHWNTIVKKNATAQAQERPRRAYIWYFVVLTWPKMRL